FGKLFQAPVPRVENPSGQPTRAETSEKRVREQQTRRDHRRRYRDVPSSAPEAASGSKNESGDRGEGCAEGNNSSSGAASAAPHVECGNAQEAFICESMRRRRISGEGQRTLPAALHHLV